MARKSIAVTAQNSLSLVNLCDSAVLHVCEVDGLACGGKRAEEGAIRDAKRKMMKCYGIFLILPMYERAACINQDKYDSCEARISPFFFAARTKRM
jgi:hypothetical protein